MATRSSNENIDTIFQETYEVFLRRLEGFDEDDAAILRNSSIHSVKDLVDILETLTNHHRSNKSRLVACIKNIERFGKALSPFFEVVNIFVQTNAEYAGLVWGSIRLIYQLGSHYVTLLERLCQTLVKISRALPAYEKSIKALKRVVDVDGHQVDRRLLLSLSSVYTDIMDFCYEACILLSNRPGLRHKYRLIWRISWQPFDARFGSIIDNLQSHFDIWGTEIALVQIQLGVAQIDLSKKHRETLDVLYVQLEDHMEQMRRQRERREKVCAAEEERLKANQVQTLKIWINAPEWEELHHAALMRTMPDSTDWFFTEAQYIDWIASVNEAWDTGQTVDHGLLVVQAKPGYGKTHLCSNVIRELKSHIELSETDAWVSYYFYDKARPWAADVLAAFRAILTQLLHTHRNDLDMIDAATLMMHNGLSGQTTASREEVLGLLNWCLRRYPRGFLVIDALDESANPPDFWTCLQTALVETNDDYDLETRSLKTLQSGPTSNSITGRLAAIVFARPDVLLPNSIRQRSRVFQPYHRPHTVFESYIRAMLEQLISDDLIETEIDIEHLSRKAAQQSGDMFLWVRLLEEYVTSDGLSTQERIEALERLTYLEGLDTLYDAILDRVQKTFPKAIVSKVHRAFQWVDAATRPLYLEELREAICLPANGPLKNAHVPDFRKAIQRMSGALLEIAADDTVRFIHTSVGDFLRQSRRNFGSNTTTDVLPILESQQINQYLATCCLTYIARCIPSEPLSGSSQVVPDHHLQCTRFPLLDYVLSSWPVHVGSALKDCTCGALTTSRTSLPSHLFTKCYQMLNHLRYFITNAKSVTMWIEASWLFRIDPDTVIDTLLRHVDQRVFQAEFFRTIPAAEQSNMNHLHRDLKELSSDLARLCKEWGHVLRVTPNEIWEPSIQSQCHSRFWLDTTAAHIEQIASIEGSKLPTVLLESKVSSDASEIGLLSLVLLGRAYNEITPSSHKPLYSSNAIIVRFEVRELAHSRLRFSFTMTINLPDNHWYDHRVELPFAIADDLRKVIVVHTLAIVRHIGTRYQSEDAHGCIVDTVFFDPISLGNPIYSPVDQSQDGHLLGVIFGQDNKFLLFHHSGTGLSVFRFSSLGLPQHVKTAYWGTLRIREPNLASIVSFHPFLPLLLFATANETMLWNFGSEENHAVTVYWEPLIDTNFSMCGNHVLGSCNNITRFVYLTTLVIDATSDSTLLSSIFNRADTQMVDRIASSKLVQSADSTPEASIQSPNVISFSNGSSPGQASISLLQHFREEGMLLLTKLCEDGSVITEELSRLPRNINLEAAVLVQNQGSDEESIRIVLNVKKRRNYLIDFRRLERLEMPMILERKRESIPTFKTQLKGFIAGPQDVARLLLDKRRPYDDESEGSDSTRAVAKRPRF